MSARCALAILMGLALVERAAAAPKVCKLEKLAELPVTMASNGPLVPAKINGADTLLVADSGAFYSLISPGSAAQFKLTARSAPIHLILKGIGGSQEANITVVEQFTIAGITLHRVEFIVGGSEPGGGAAGILGQNVLRVADVEYDLANGAIRLMRPEGCDSANLAYWVKEGPAYSVMEISYATPQEPNIAGVAYLNGTRLRVVFDTGAQASMLTLRATERLGINPDSPGVVPAGNFHGIGRQYVRTWLAPFQSFKIGDEEIRNTQLRFTDASLGDIDMLLGDDFFLSHRIYVASSQRKLYFTYNGGPVFNLRTSPAQPAAAATAAASEPPALDSSLDAEGFARRGAASISRREYGAAIADLTHACEMAPQEPRYFFERARAYVANGQTEPGLADLGQVLKLKADDVQALLMRAQLRLSAHDESGAVADLDAADHAAAQQADDRLAIGRMYARAGRLPQAIAQYDRWIDAHPEDVRVASAYLARCRARGVLGFELPRALADCNKANRMAGGNARILEVRGLLRLRMGDYGRAISDFDASLKVNPRNAWALYGRGQAERHEQKNGAAEQDLAAAAALQPGIAEEFEARGFAAPE